MEESEKRKERLKVMRLEAAQAEVSNNVETPAMAGCISNPLIETSTTMLTLEESCATPRFDFYTDPMSAFSANKKRNKSDSQIGQDYFSSPSNNIGSPMAPFSSSIQGPRSAEMTPSPNIQMQSNPRLYQAQGPYDSDTIHMGPRGMASSSPFYQGTFPEAWNESRATTGYYSSASHRSPRGIVGPFPMHQGTPEAWNRSGGRGSFSFPSNPSYAPPGRPSFNYGQDKAHWLGNSPSPGSGHGGSHGPSSGRGRGGWYGGIRSPSIGRGGGRGQSCHSRGLGPNDTLGPECFYHESMEEDPWKDLRPVLLRSLGPPASNLKSPSSSTSWLPKSISMKKQRVSEASNKSNSQQSLAEYLAASLNEAVNDYSSMGNLSLDAAVQLMNKQQDIP